ncbi:MAG: hypothetical protein KDK06_22970 [Gammaproteobacteria bacterium]|nr:hypothetical protein [Gammaproteobacteria bacterium]
MPVPQRFGAVMWLSFLMATVATGVFFSIIDPDDLRYCVPFPEVSRMAAYTIGFFLFWLLTAASGVLAVAFTYPPDPDETPRRDG